MDNTSYVIVVNTGDKIQRTGLKSMMRFVYYNYKYVDYILDGEDRIEKEAIREKYILSTPYKELIK